MLTDKVKDKYDDFLKSEENLPSGEIDKLRLFFSREGILIGGLFLDPENTHEYKSFAASKPHGIAYSSTESFSSQDEGLWDAIEKANEYYNTRLNHPDNFELEKIIKDVIEKSN